MATSDAARQIAEFQRTSLTQQGYDYNPRELAELSWGLRFTPTVCMAGAIVGLATQKPGIHFALAVLGILPAWLPAWNPVDLLYNYALRPLWGGVKLPPNPLPRRIACFMGGSMNLGIGAAFLWSAPAVAYALGAVLIALQLVVITTHFCVASWMYEGALRAIGKWMRPIPVGRAKELIEAGAELVDVRNPEEFAREHLPGARNVPLEQVVDVLGGNPERSFVFYCQSGLRSQRATQALKRQGHDRTYNLGAMSRWGQSSQEGSGS